MIRGLIFDFDGLILDTETPGLVVPALGRLREPIAARSLCELARLPIGCDVCCDQSTQREKFIGPFSCCPDAQSPALGPHRKFGLAPSVLPWI